MSERRSTSAEDPKSDSPCEDCPWRKQKQTKAAIEASPVGGDGRHWFAIENILRRWKEAADRGFMLPCHLTDPRAPFYGGKPAKAGNERICVGLSMLARREVFTFMTCGNDYERYRKLRGYRFSPVALAAWATRLYFGGAKFDVAERSFTMPTLANDEDDRTITVPWKDDVHAQKRTRK